LIRRRGGSIVAINSTFVTIIKAPDCPFKNCVNLIHLQAKPHLSIVIVIVATCHMQDIRCHMSLVIVAASHLYEIWCCMAWGLWLRGWREEKRRQPGSQAVEPAGAAVLHTLPLYAQPAAVITAIW
jgi:hypothetical protein